MPTTTCADPPPPLEQANETPLDIAIRQHATDLVLRLLACGADANNANADGCTPQYYNNGYRNGYGNRNQDPPLVAAMRLGNVEVIKALLAAGARANVKDSQVQHGTHGDTGNALSSERVALINNRVLQLPSFG